jgi:zeaxanthin glucosyltransferase
MGVKVSSRMSYYAMLLPAYVGHLNPMLVLGAALKAREHRVSFIAPLDAGPKIVKAGFPFIPIAQTEFPLGGWDRTAAQMGKLTGFGASRFTGKWLARFARGILRDLPAIAAREKFDGLVLDQVAIGGESVCQAIGLPMALACNALILHFESTVPPQLFSWPYNPSWPHRVRNLMGQLLLNTSGFGLLREVSPYRSRHKLPSMRFDHVNIMPPSLVQVSQQPAFFDFPRRKLPPNFHYTGPWLEPEVKDDPEFPWEKLNGRPLIYASMGTLQNGLEHVFHTIAEACIDLEAQLVIGLGRKTASLAKALPGNPMVVDYAPQRALLRRASLVITHGGLNTTLEALSVGVPLVALPITNDQPGVAARIQHLGLGETLPIGQLTPAQLRQLIGKVLTNPEYCTRARECAQKISRQNGAAEAARLIEAAFSQRAL